MRRTFEYTASANQNSVMIEGGLQTFGVACGQLVGYGFYFVKGQAQWRVPVGIQLIPALIVCVFINFLPESPRWLVKHGMFEEVSGISHNEYQTFAHTARQPITYASFEASVLTTQFSLQSATLSSLHSKPNLKWSPSPTRSCSRTARPRLCTELPLVPSSKPLSSSLVSTWSQPTPTRSFNSPSTWLPVCRTLSLPWAASNTRYAQFSPFFLLKVWAGASLL